MIHKRGMLTPFVVATAALLTTLSAHAQGGGRSEVRGGQLLHLDKRHISHPDQAPLALRPQLDRLGRVISKARQRAVRRRGQQRDEQSIRLFDQSRALLARLYDGDVAMRAGRASPQKAASVSDKGTTVGTRRGLPRPTVELAHQLQTGIAERGTMFNFFGARNQTVVTLGHVSAGTKVQLYQQSQPQLAPAGAATTASKARPRWQPVGGPQTIDSEPQGGKHRLVLEQGIVSHTPLKVMIKRPGADKPFAISGSMPATGPKSTGNFYGAEGLYRAKYANWSQPETVKRTVAYQGPDGSPQVTVRGKLSAPATARVSIFNQTTGAESRPKLMRAAFTTTVKAEPGHHLELKIQFADGTVQSKPLGIVPDAVEPTYQPQIGLHYFPFTKNHIR